MIRNSGEDSIRICVSDLAVVLHFVAVVFLSIRWSVLPAAAEEYYYESTGVSKAKM